jgi:hypothetical protein
MMRVLQAALIFIGLLSLPASACSVHDHSCNFHGMGRVVNPNIDPAAPTAVYIVTEGTTSSDFDNNVLLPDGQGPYVISSTGYPARSDQPYIGTTEQPRHVYPTQYQIDFNNNTAQATHSGDLNGLENIPGATGCQISSASNCEEIRIVGNIPDTFASDGIGFFVRQTNHLYNAQNVADPSNELQSYAVATGSAFIRTFGHGFVDESGTRTGYNYDSLTTTGQQGQENTYYIGYSGFQPHAMGAPVYYNERWSTYGSAYETQLQHKIYTYQDRTDHSQQRFVSGAGETWTDNYGSRKTTNTLGVVTIPEHLRGIYSTVSSMVDAETGRPYKPSQNLRFAQDYYNTQIVPVEAEIASLEFELQKSKNEYNSLGDFRNQNIGFGDVYALYGAGYTGEVYVDASNLNIMTFKNRHITLGFGDYLVHGQTWVEGGEMASGEYNFEYHGDSYISKNPMDSLRNMETTVGRIVHGTSPLGQEDPNGFVINYEGSPQISKPNLLNATGVFLYNTRHINPSYYLQKAFYGNESAEKSYREFQVIGN